MTNIDIKIEKALYAIYKTILTIQNIYIIGQNMSYQHLDYIFT